MINLHENFSFAKSQLTIAAEMATVLLRLLQVYKNNTKRVLYKYLLFNYVSLYFSDAYEHK